MLKKMMLLAVAAAAVLAVAAPAASANWTHSGAELKTNANVTFSGETSFAGELGTVTCKQLTGAATLTGSSSHGTLQSFSVDSPTTNCEVGGVLGALCGTTSLESVHLEAGNVPTLTATTTNIKIDNVKWIYLFGSEPNPCLELNLRGDLTATPNNPESISSVAFSGTLEDTTLEAQVALSGSLAASPAGTYGTK